MKKLFRFKPKKAVGEPQWHHQSQCRLLQLPGELRNQIWSLAFTSDDDYISLNNLEKPALTSTCRQIEHEALPLFFDATQFSLTVTVKADWHADWPLIAGPTAAWIKAPGPLAGPFHTVRFFISRPDKHFRAMDLLPIQNEHFNTAWAICLKEDQSDFPHCSDYFIASRWTSLAYKVGNTKLLDFAGVVDLAIEAAGTWVPSHWRFFKRHPILRKRMRRLRPKVLLVDPTKKKKACECEKCNQERRDRKRAEKEEKKKEAARAKAT